MKRKINNVFSLKRYCKRVLLSSLLILFISQIYSQTILPKRAKLKTITYSSYTISGYVYKKEFVEDQVLTIISRDNYDTILSGRYYHDEHGNSYIEGINTKRNYSDNSRTQGIFRVSNTKNELRITTNKKEAYKLIFLLEDLTYYQNNKYYYGNYSNFGTLVLQKLPNDKYSLIIKYEGCVLETVLPYSKDNNVIEVNLDYNKVILNSQQVKLTFNNGDIFIGEVKRRSKLPAYCHYNIPYAPDSGEYKYASGEISTGVFECNNYFNRFYLEEGVTVFLDGTKCKGDWLFDQNLTSSEQERIYSKDRSPTEMKNMAKSIIEEKEKKLQEEKAAQEQEERQKLQQQELRRRQLIEKYGEYYGNKICAGELALGMSQEMVNEYWPKKYFNISNINRNYNNTVIWKFDKKKMQREIIKEGKETEKEDGALALLLMLNFSEQLGGLDVPKMLVFKNNKLTEIYR
ncbi:hypothetical protein [Ancylomarina longa]|uniref:Uncharacterized protein n=1 Tax=Ancylomarina longa TaxID=2487017 RepID=A0A434AG07_9BACT|nr:hypothetical protein [Ancylomarina longa]RUT73307.1 hypothetical protein DLK05_14135 [Ancylomarina longa]